MKVAHLFWSLSYGGIETMLVNIANMQARLGTCVSVIIINDLIDPDLEKELLPIVHFVRLNRRLGTKSLSFMCQLNRELDNINPDVVHLHNSVLLNYLCEHRRRMSCCVVTLHEMPFGKVGMKWRWGNMVENLLLHQKGIVRRMNVIQHRYAISEAVADALKDKYGLDSTVISNGIKTGMFVKRDMHLFENKMKVVQVGRLAHDVKGQDLLIEAVGILKREFKLDILVTFIGEGPSIKHLEELSRNQNLSSSITFFGKQDQKYIANHLCDYDLFVQPSRHEGFGLTVAEAMSANVPVLVSSGQGPSEVTKGECYGWTFKNGDSMDLASKIFYISQHYNQALDKSTEAHQHVVRNYDVSITARSYLNEYERIIKRQNVE